MKLSQNKTHVLSLPIRKYLYSIEVGRNRQREVYQTPLIYMFINPLDSISHGGRGQHIRYKFETPKLEEEEVELNMEARQTKKLPRAKGEETPHESLAI